MARPAVKREAVAHLKAELGLSERRACRIVGADRKMTRYRSVRPPETALRKRLRDLANERRRFGYRRLFVLLRREDEPSGINPELSIGKQCKLLSISRSSFYYQPKGETALNLTLMRQIDEQFLETPFFGVRQMTWHLRNEGHLVDEKRIRRLMRLMGLMP
ncbi:HTH-like domain-containing protein, partial [Jhaorihella thermophila]